jgi:hypothetical protein
MILGLCSDDVSDLKGFAAELRSDIYIAKPTNAVKSKRKAKQQINDNTSAVQVDDSQPVATAEAIENRKDESPKGIILEADAQIDNQKEGAEIDSAEVETDLTKQAETPINPVIEDYVNIPNKCDSEVEVTSSTAGDAAKTDLEPAEEGSRTEGNDAFVTPQKVGSRNEHSNNTPISESVKGELGASTSNPGDVQINPSEEEKKCEDQVKQNPSDKGSGSSTKRKTKGKSSAPTRSKSSSRRNTRQSGRLASVLSSNETPVVAGSEPTRAAAPVGILDGMALQIENAKKMKIRGLEKLAKGQYMGEGIWPIAGRRIFPTEGNLAQKGRLCGVN